MKTSDFEYSLPKELIAQEALKNRDEARLMVAGKKIEHRHFYDILDYLDNGDVLVINETKVVKAKLSGKKSTGAPAEILVENRKGDYYECRIKTRHPLPGNVINLKDGLKAEIIGTDGDYFKVRFSKRIEDILEREGELPQPTYIKRKVSDEEYQTVYASKPGSMAAPTAGLHFTKELLEKAGKKGVKIARICLHIGFGTFLSIESSDVEGYKIHSEFFEIGNAAAEAINSCKGSIVAVGTTTLRALESADYKEGKIMPCSGWTGVFIKPGYGFKSNVSKMITNFHLPRSTLLLLVCAFAGRKKVLGAYSEAIKERYRFYSLGDAMLLFRENLQPQ